MYTPDELVKVAVHDIVAGINTGLSPQESTIKVAKELNLNHNFIKRSAEAINVALHHNHFKNNPDAKADEFPIVDAQKVAEEIYGVKEKTASVYKSELFSSFQTTELTPKFARYLEEGPYKEQYAKFINTEITKQATSEKGVYEKSANYIHKLKKIAFEKEAAAMDAKFQINKSFCAILHKFAQDALTRSSWDEFETAVYNKYGNDSSNYLDLLYKASDLKEERGHPHDPPVKLASNCPELELYDKFIDSIEFSKKASEESDEAVLNLSFEQNYVKEAFALRGCELNKQAYSEIDPTLLERVEASLSSERVKVAQAASEDPVIAYIAEKKAAVLEEFDSRIKSAIDLLDMATGGAKDAYTSIGKPSLSASSNTPENNRNRALMLQELITTDPVISKFPTHQTVDAYQQMLRIAPELSQEKEITRAFLRQAGASQAIDPFQAEQLIKANTSLFKQHQLQQGVQPAPEPK